MDTQHKSIFRFIVLIPHRDALKSVIEYREKLFASGTCGAYSFPLVAPLALVCEPFRREELKDLVKALRNCTKNDDGKILGTGLAHFRWTAEYIKHEIYGIRLSIPTEENLFPRKKLVRVFSPSALSVALTGPGEKPPSGVTPALSFRAASVANLAIRPLACDYSFEWIIGPQIWLPRKGINQ